MGALRPPVRPGPLAQARIGAQLLRSTGPALVELRRRFGDVVDVGYGPLRITYLFGTEANEHVLQSNADNFRWGPAFEMLEVVDGPTALVLTDGPDHKRRRRLVQPAFAKKRVDAHLSLIVDELDRALDEWTPGARFRAHPQLRGAIRRIVLRSLFGDQLGDRADEVGELLEPALKYVSRWPFARFDHDLRVNAFARVVRGVRAADAVVREEVARRRAEGIDADRDPDVLSALLVGADTEQATTEASTGDTEPARDDRRAATRASVGGERPGDATVLSDAEVLDQVRSLVAAGYDTTSAVSAWVVHELGRNPDVCDAVRAQVRDTIGDAPPTIDDLRRMPLVDGVVREVLRLWPPGFVAGRRAVAPFEVAGHRVEGDRMVVYSAYVSGRDPELWAEPDRFAPERWAAGPDAAPPYAFLPFGGGVRRCIGFALATLELQVLVVRLVQRARWTLDRPDVGSTGIAAAVPKGGVPVTVL